MVKKQDFPKPDINHQFVDLSPDDEEMLEKGREILKELMGKRDAVYWYCIRYWMDQQYKEEIHEIP